MKRSIGKLTSRFVDNPGACSRCWPYSPERIARVNHSSEGQSYEALFNAIRYEHDPKLLATYQRWLRRVMGFELDGREFALHLYDCGSHA